MVNRILIAILILITLPIYAKERKFSICVPKMEYFSYYNIPILIYENDGVSDSIDDLFWQEVDNSGASIHFYKEDEITPLYHELKYIDVSTHKIQLYVEPSNESKLIWCYFGDNNYETDCESRDIWNTHRFVSHFEDDPLSQITDESIYGNHLDPRGSMTVSDLVEGKIGNGIDMDGSDDGLRANYHSSLYSDDLTWSFWYYNRTADYGANNCGLVALYDNYDGNNKRVALVWIDGIVGGDDRLAINVSSNGTDFEIVTTAPYITPTVNEWTHITVVYLKLLKRWSIYVNGALAGAYTATTDFTNQESHFEVGCYVAGTFDGIIDEVRYHQNSLSATMIQAQYENLNSPDDSYIVGSIGYEPTAEIDTKKITGYGASGTGSITDVGFVVDLDANYACNIAGYIDTIHLNVTSPIESAQNVIFVTLERDGDTLRYIDSTEELIALTEGVNIITLSNYLCCKYDSYIAVCREEANLVSNTSTASANCYYLADDITIDNNNYETDISEWTATGINENLCIVGYNTTTPRIDIGIIGDSIAAGRPTHNTFTQTDNTDKGYYHSQAMYYYAQNYDNLIWLNTGIGSDMFHDNLTYTYSPGTANRIERNLFWLNPRKIFIHCGTNDLYNSRTWTQIKAELDNIVAISANYDSDIYLAEVLPRQLPSGDQSAFNQAIQDLNAYYAEYCDNEGWTLLECYDDFYLEGDDSLQDTSLFQDNVHPTHTTTENDNDGYEVLGDAYYNSYQYIRPRPTGSTTAIFKY